MVGNDIEWGGYIDMRSVKLPLLLIAVSLLLLAYVPARAQIKDQKMFDVIPAAQRPGLIPRLHLYVEYLLTRQQSKLETLYDEDTLCRVCKGKQNFAENCAPPMTVEVPEGYAETIVDFKPRAIKLDREPQSYAIEVEEQDRVSSKGKRPWIRKTTVHVYALFERGDWYFSLVAIPGTVLM